MPPPRRPPPLKRGDGPALAFPCRRRATCPKAAAKTASAAQAAADRAGSVREGHPDDVPRGEQQHGGGRLAARVLPALRPRIAAAERAEFENALGVVIGPIRQLGAFVNSFAA